MNEQKIPSWFFLVFYANYMFIYCSNVVLSATIIKKLLAFGRKYVKRRVIHIIWLNCSEELKHSRSQSGRKHVAFIGWYKNRFLGEYGPKLNLKDGQHVVFIEWYVEKLAYRANFTNARVTKITPHRTTWEYIIVRYHCGGRPEEVNSCVLNSYMVYL
jgi:hypothetical protein